MRKLVRYIVPISNESNSKLHNFSRFTLNYGYKTSKFTFAACAEVCA